MIKPGCRRKSQFSISKLVIGLLVIITSFGFGHWSFCAEAQQTFPQLDISGFKKWEYKNVEVNPPRNYFLGLSNLGGYYPTFSGSPWQERLQLKILGLLSENLSTTYDLEQQPESPDKFDVKVKYFNNELTFGDLTANFSGNEFISASKYLNGVMLTAKDDWYDIVAVPSAKLKSQTQALTSQKGNNTRGPYNLGHGGIIEGSEQIQLNGTYLKRNVDYTIDYFEGKITFNRILDTTDEFKYSYEYTNIIDLFFPTLSKRDFFGFQSRLTIDPEKFGKPVPKEEPVISSARDVFPRVGTIEPEVQEEESSGRYRLSFYPVITFSEKLTFMGTDLKKNEDYLIRYDTGEIKLLTKFLPTSEEALVVEYRYYQTSSEVEKIPGIGSRGPYRTKHQNIIPESEKIEVDGKLFMRDLDYTINFNRGEILFGLVISPTSQIKISYRYQVMALPPTIPSKFPRELKIGTTYLKETAQKSVGTPTYSAMESVTGQTLINSNYILKLSNRPVSTSEAPLTIRIRRGTLSWQLTPEVDYTIPTTEVDPATGYVTVYPNVKLSYTTDRSDPTNGYGTGTIYFYNSSLNLQPSDEVTVTYTYYKSIVGQFSGVGDGSRGPYYLRNIRKIVPGTETVQVYTQGSATPVTYTRNSSFEPDAGDTGYSFNYNEDNPSITFNKELPTNKNFQIIFQYVPPSSTTGGDISQSVFGLDGSFKIGDVFKIDSSFARSESDRVYSVVPTIESFSGRGTKNYTLNSPADLIEDSEKIYINNQLLNRDADYFINYSRPGTFNFYYITPTTADAIRVEYSYQGISPLTVTTTKSDTAFRLGAETKIFGDMLTLNGTTKKIGFDFSPLGSTAIGVGSEYDEYNLLFKPSFHSFYTNYSYKYNKNPIGASRQFFLRTYDNSVSAGINPGGLAKIDLSYRTYASIDDLSSPEALHNNDSLQDTYSASLIPSEWKRGAISFNQKYDLRKTISKSDNLDAQTLGYKPPTSIIDYYHANGELKFTDRLSVGYDYQYNELSSTDSQEVKSSHSRTLDHSYNLDLDLTMLFLQKWTARVSLLDHNEYKIVPTPESTISTRNETYHTDITPFSILTASLDHNRQERIAYASGAANPLSTRTSANARLSPFSWLSLGASASKSETIPETGVANKTTSRTNAYDLDYTPISFSFLKIGSRFAASDSYAIAPLGTESVRTDTNTFSQNYNMNLNIIPILPLTFGYTKEDYKNYNNSTTSPVSTETQNLTTTVGLTFTPSSVFTLTGNYNQKITKDLLRGTSPVKTTIDAKASYQVFSWGTLSLDWSSEKNEGEVQGGVMTSLNTEKDTLNRTLNITIPVDNPVLSNFTILITWKSVNFRNLAKPDKSDDFYAQLMTFEGTMNF